MKGGGFGAVAILIIAIVIILFIAAFGGAALLGVGSTDVLGESAVFHTPVSRLSTIFEFN